LLQKYNIDYQKYISYVLIAYAFSFPLSKAATNLFEVLALLLWIAEGNWREKFALYKTNILSLTIALLIGFSVVSIVFHGAPESTLKYIAKYRHLLVIFVFYTSFKKEYSQYLLSGFLAAMFISEIVSYGIFFEVIHYKNISPNDPTPFMSHMTYSTLLAFTSSILLIQFFHSHSFKSKLIYGLFFLSVTANLFMNGGRSGQVIFIVLMFFLFLRHIQSKIKALLLVTSLLVIVFTTAYTQSPNFHDRILQLKNDIHLMVEQKDYSSSAGARIALNIIALHTFLDHILLGTGIGNDMNQAAQYAQQLQLHVDDISIYADAHNTFATIATQLGVVGLLITILLLYAIFSFPYKNVASKDMALMFALTFTLFSLTHNTLHTMNPMVFFALFAGYFNALSRIETT